MAEIRDQYILDIENALRQVEGLERGFRDAARAASDVSIDESSIEAAARSSDQLGAELSRAALAAADAGTDARLIGEALELARRESVDFETAISRVSSETSSTAEAMGRVSQALNISEEEARQLAQSVAASSRESQLLDADLEAVARSMGLSESEARAFAAEMRGASSASSDVTEKTERMDRAWVRIVARVGAAVAAAFSLRNVLAAGFQRFTTIEDSTRALTIQLGDAAAAGQVLQDVLDVVRGTPFNLDQFAAAAQQLISFGVEAERIPSILTAIGEAAASQGARAPEFVDRLVTVFGQITATGRVALDDINRIASSGVNALAILANAFGVTTEEMRNMISQGAVPVEQAIDALAQGIVEGTDGIAGATVAMGGTMEGLRETLTGARGGLNAAVARLGEAFFELAGPEITRGLQELTSGVDALTESVRESEDVIGPVIRFVVDLQRGFGQVGDSARAGFAVVSAGLLTAAQTAIPLIDASEAIQSRLDDLNQVRFDTRLRIQIQGIINDLRAGVEPIDSFSQRIIQLAQDTEAPEEFAAAFERMARTAGVSVGDTVAVLDRLTRAGERAGLSAGEIEALRRIYEGLSDTIGPAAAEAIRFGNIQDRVRREAAAAASELEVSLLTQTGAFRILTAAAQEAGVPISELSAEEFPELAAALSIVEPATLGLAQASINISEFAERFAASNASLATQIDIFSALPDELETSKEEFLANLEVTAEETARFEAGLFDLFEIAPALATALREQGPAARGLLQDFLEDAISAERAESILRGQAEDLTGQFTDQVLASIRAARGDPEQLEALAEFISGFSNPAVIGPGLDLLFDEIRRQLAVQEFRVPVTVLPTLSGLEFQRAVGKGGGAPAGVFEINQEINTTPERENTDVARATQIASSTASNLQVIR